MVSIGKNNSRGFLHLPTESMVNGLAYFFGTPCVVVSNFTLILYPQLYILTSLYKYTQKFFNTESTNILMK